MPRPPDNLATIQSLIRSAQEPARGSAGLVEVLMKASSLLPYAVLASAVLSLCATRQRPASVCFKVDRLQWWPAILSRMVASEFCENAGYGLHRSPGSTRATLLQVRVLPAANRQLNPAQVVLA